MEIYGPPTKCLGDCWAFMNMICDKSIRNKAPVLCSKFIANKMHGIHSSRLVEGKLVEILSALDAGEAKIDFIYAGATVFTPDSVNFQHPYRPTKIKWEGGKSIVHQLVNSEKDISNNKRCIPQDQNDAIIKWISQRENAALGLPMSIEECIRTASKAALFIGMDSGMSHICHSLGIPVLIYDWPRIDEFHRNKTFSRFKTADEAIALMSGIMG